MDENKKTKTDKKNMMVENPSYFDDIQKRNKWLRYHRFLPVFDVHSDPNIRGTVYPETKYFMPATFKKDYYEEAMKNHKRLHRDFNNIIPTAFVFRFKKGLSITEQANAIVRQSGILSIVLDGDVLVVTVPIQIKYGEIIASKGKICYRKCWKSVGRHIFSDMKLIAHHQNTGTISPLPGKYPCFYLCEDFVFINCFYPIAEYYQPEQPEQQKGQQ